jgi:hypothetical protein
MANAQSVRLIAFKGETSVLALAIAAAEFARLQQVLSSELVAIRQRFRPIAPV